MKKTKIIYWIFTGIFAAFMALGAVQNIAMSEDSVKLITHLGYPLYFISFIGVAKLLGSVALVVPGFPRIKEWAYAGFFFDLVGATYSQIATDGFLPPIAFMLVFFIFEAVSYIYYHKLLKQSNGENKVFSVTSSI